MGAPDRARRAGCGGGLTGQTAGHLMQSIRNLIGAVASSLRRGRVARSADRLEVELSHDEWSQFRPDRRVPLCIATKHIRS